MVDTDILKDLPKRPRIRMSYHFIPMSDNRVQFRSGTDAFIVHGQIVQELIREVFPLLNGEHSVEFILKSLDSSYPKDAVITFLKNLTQRRVLEDATLGPPEFANKKELDCHTSQLSYFSHYSPNPYEEQSKLRRARVALWGLGPLGARLATSLAQAGVGEIIGIDAQQIGDVDIYNSPLSQTGRLGQPRAEALVGCVHGMSYTQWQGHSEKIATVEDLVPLLQDVDYLAVCQESIRPLDLELCNRACLDLGLTWTWCALDSHTGTIGPTVIPRQLACWKCYDLRVKANVDHYEEYMAFDDYLRNGDGEDVSFGYLAPSLDALAGLAALEIIKDLSGLTPPLTYGAQISVNLLTTTFDLHPVLKLPRCPACSRAEKQGAAVRPFLERE